MLYRYISSLITEIQIKYKEEYGCKYDDDIEMKKLEYTLIVNNIYDKLKNKEQLTTITFKYIICEFENERQICIFNEFFRNLNLFDKKIVLSDDCKSEHRRLFMCIYEIISREQSEINNHQTCYGDTWEKLEYDNIFNACVCGKY